MSTSYYRIQDASRSVEALLDPEMQFSPSYSSEHIGQGISACRSIEDLAAYLVQSGMPWDPDTYVLVEMDADLSGDTDEDHELGARLVIPAAIISTTPVMDTDLLDLIDAAYAA